jgi:hypothetical protein
MDYLRKSKYYFPHFQTFLQTLTFIFLIFGVQLIEKRLNFAIENNNLINSNLKTERTMAKTFVIGDREKNEWISVFDNNKKQLEFKNSLNEAKTYDQRRSAEVDLKLLQETGFFGDLRVYLCEDGKAYVAGERDGFQP